MNPNDITQRQNWNEQIKILFKAKGLNKRCKYMKSISIICIYIYSESIGRKTKNKKSVKEGSRKKRE